MDAMRSRPAGLFHPQNLGSAPIPSGYYIPPSSIFFLFLAAMC